MKPSCIVVGVAVGRRAAAVHGLDVAGLDDRAAAALRGLDRRCRAAHEHAGLVDLRLAEAVRGREVPLLAGRQASDHLLTSLNEPTVGLSAGIYFTDGKLVVGNDGW